jgi:hypothetical protein
MLSLLAGILFLSSTLAAPTPIRTGVATALLASLSSLNPVEASFSTNYDILGHMPAHLGPFPIKFPFGRVINRPETVEVEEENEEDKIYDEGKIESKNEEDCDEVKTDLKSEEGEEVDDEFKGDVQLVKAEVLNAPLKIKQEHYVPEIPPDMGFFGDFGGGF